VLDNGAASAIEACDENRLGRRPVRGDRANGRPARRLETSDQPPSWRWIVAGLREFSSRSESTPEFSGLSIFGLWMVPAVRAAPLPKIRAGNVLSVPRRCFRLAFLGVCHHPPFVDNDGAENILHMGCRHGGQRLVSRIWSIAMALRIVVVEDDLLVREGIVRLLSTAPDLEVVASCGDFDEAVAAFEREGPDVVLTDIRMPPTQRDEGIRLARRLRASHPRTGVVVVSQYSDPDLVLGLFEAGSDRRAYLLKERISDRTVLVSAIRSVAAGGSSVDPKIVDVLVFARSGEGGSSRLDELTPREREVLAAIAQGKSNSLIAEELFLTRRTVEKNVNSIFLKLGLSHTEDVSKRVKATLIFLAETHTSPVV